MGGGEGVDSRVYNFRTYILTSAIADYQIVSAKTNRLIVIGPTSLDIFPIISSYRQRQRQRNILDESAVLMFAVYETEKLYDNKK